MTRYVEIILPTGSSWFQTVFIGCPSNPWQYKTQPDKVNLFVGSLVFHKTGIMHNIKLNRILAASVISFHETFSGIIGNWQYGKYKDSTHHTLHHKIISVLSDTRIPMANVSNGKINSLKVLTTRIGWGSTFQKMAAVLQKFTVIDVASLG